MNVNKKIIISLIIFGMAILIFIVLIICPLFNGIKEKSEEFIFQKKTLMELEAKARNLKEFQAICKNYQPNLEKIGTLFVNAAEPIAFIEFLEKEAGSSQLVFINDISPFSPREVRGDPWPSMNFQLSPAGSFPNFLKFLEKLESSTYLIEVLNLNVRKLTEKEVPSEKFEGLSIGDVNVTLLIKAYSK